MKTPKPIQIFKTGTHTAMSGAALSFSESDLAAAAKSYDPTLHEAPIVVGHPRHDLPAYGWVKSLAFADGALEASPHQVNADFAELVASGAFKKISASFYTPDSPSNPVPGGYYLRHVGFLGAQSPAVKGLRMPEFAETEQGVIEFADWDDVQVSGLFRSMREWIISKFSLEDADKAIPGYTVSNLETSAQQETEDPADTTDDLPAHQFAEGETMSAEDQARLSALEAENATLKAESAQRASAARHAENVAFSETLIQTGKLLPAQKDVCLATLDFMAGQEQAVEFGEGDAKQPLLQAFKEFMQALPKQVEFSEVSAAGKEESASVSFAAPDGFTVDAERLALHQRATAHAATHNVTYAAALAAVN